MISFLNKLSIVVDVGGAFDKSVLLKAVIFELSRGVLQIRYYDPSAELQITS